MSHFLDEKTILITGGAGAWGRALIRQILQESDVREIRIYSHGESAQVEMRNEFPDNRLKFIIGDVRVPESLDAVMDSVNYVFHLAAMKHVPVCEENPWEAVLTNIIGTRNVIESASRHSVRMVVYVSSDKAVEPFNLYGLTKACSEKLIVTANQRPGNLTRFTCIRGGNVIGTPGSVIPIFMDQIRRWNRLSVTDGAMTRFFMTLREAIALMLYAAETARGGEIFVKKMSAFSIGSLARLIAEAFGDTNTAIDTIGVRAGEKMHEMLISRNEAEFTKDLGSGYLAILPRCASSVLRATYESYPDFKMVYGSSECARRLSVQELRGLLDHGTGEEFALENTASAQLLY